MAIWQLQTAKAKLSELLRAVRDEGPQVISVRGKEEFVVSLRTPGAAHDTPKTGLDLVRPVLGLGVTLDLPHRDPEGHRDLFLAEDNETDFTGEP